MISLTGKQIYELALFAGIPVNEELFTQDETEHEELMETTYHVYEDVKVMDDGTGNYYQGAAVCLTEYPEEGYLPLNDNLIKPEEIVLEDYCNE